MIKKIRTNVEKSSLLNWQEIKFVAMLESSYSKALIEAGCDEAGRGCLAGPVTAAAVILPLDYKNKELNDSKQLSRKKRDQLKQEIEKEAMSWAIAHASSREIDTINILNASYLAMHRALDQLNQKPDLLLIDGNRFNPYQDIPHQCIVKGDATFASIAAASVLAKWHRDHFMEQLAEQYPGYIWEHNKGYPTRGHRKAIKSNGITPYHRKSFQLLPAQMELFEENFD